MFLSRLGQLQAGKEKLKWRENVYRVQYSGDCRARWKVVIGGKSNICSFLSYTWIAASHMRASVRQQGGKCRGEQRDRFNDWEAKWWTHFTLFARVWVAGLKWKGTVGVITSQGWEVKLKLRFDSADRVNDAALWARAILTSCYANILRVFTLFIQKPWWLSDRIQDAFFLRFKILRGIFFFWN